MSKAMQAALYVPLFASLLLTYSQAARRIENDEGKIQGQVALEVQPQRLEVQNSSSLDGRLATINAHTQGYQLDDALGCGPEGPYPLKSEYGLRGWCGVKILRALHDSYSEKKGVAVIDEINRRQKAGESLETVAGSVLDMIFPSKCQGPQCAGLSTCPCWKPSDGTTDIYCPVVPSQFGGRRQRGVMLILADFLVMKLKKVGASVAGVPPSPRTSRATTRQQPAVTATRPTRTVTRSRTAARTPSSPVATPVTRRTSVTKRTPARATGTSQANSNGNASNGNGNSALQECKKELGSEIDQEFKATMCCRRKCNRNGSCTRDCQKSWKNKEY